MGNQCLQYFFPQSQSQALSITQMETHLQPLIHSTNDQYFLYFPSFFEMENNIGFAVQKGKNIQPIKQKLFQYVSELNNYLLSKPYMDSLSQINNNLNNKSSDNLCYLCIEIQAVQLSFPIKTLNIDVTTNKNVSVKTVTKQKMDASKVFRPLSCFKVYTQQSGYLIIKIGDLSCSLQVKQICKQLAVVQVLNLRKEGNLDPLGQISIRVQAVKNIQTWQNKSLSLLQSRKKQIQKILQVNYQGMDSSAKVFLPTSLSERGFSRLSYYKDQHLDYIILDRTQRS